MNVAFCRDCGRYVALEDGGCPKGHARPALHDVGERTPEEAERLFRVGLATPPSARGAAAPASPAFADFDRVSPLFAPLTGVRRRLNRYQYVAMVLWLAPALVALVAATDSGLKPLLPAAMAVAQMFALALAYTVILSFSYDVSDLGGFDAWRDTAGLMLLPVQALSAVWVLAPPSGPLATLRMLVVASWALGWVMLVVAAQPRRGPVRPPSALDEAITDVADTLLSPAEPLDVFDRGL
jgi:hypothetical protein